MKIPMKRHRHSWIVSISGGILILLAYSEIQHHHPGATSSPSYTRINRHPFPCVALIAILIDQRIPEQLATIHQRHHLRPSEQECSQCSPNTISEIICWTLRFDGGSRIAEVLLFGECGVRQLYELSRWVGTTVGLTDKFTPAPTNTNTNTNTRMQTFMPSMPYARNSRRRRCSRQKGTLKNVWRWRWRQTTQRNVAGKAAREHKCSSRLTGGKAARLLAVV